MVLMISVERAMRSLIQSERSLSSTVESRCSRSSTWERDGRTVCRRKTSRGKPSTISSRSSRTVRSILYRWATSDQPLEATRTLLLCLMNSYSHFWHLLEFFCPPAVDLLSLFSLNVGFYV